ncbi:carboxypeptidase regulatory-like domain-containing protein, partial [bacterium]|nr:carboxypeptidase regulatory-like domain-containing protein [bacterium]
MVKRTDRGFAKLRSTRSFMVAMCTVVLLMLCSFSYAGPNNIMRDPSFESLTVGTTLTTSSISLGTIRFVNVGTASGQLQVISPGEDGNVAVKVSKTSDSDLVQIDLDVNPTLTWIPVQGGHTYRVSFWARTDDPGSAIVLAEAGFQGWTHYGSQYPGWGLTSDWTMYTTEWTAPASANLLDLAFVLNTPGSFVIDNISIEDVAPATNLMPDPSFESLTTGTTVTAIGANNVGDYIRFVNNYGASSTTGKLEVVSQAEDGGKAVKLSKVANDSVWMDLSAAPPSSWIPVKGGHSYRITYWARTDDAKNVISTISSGFGVSEKFLGDTQNGWKDVMPNWLLYAEQWTAPEEATHLNLQFWIASPTGSVVVDNIHVEEIIPAVSSLTGTVTSMLSGAVIAGANVSVSSGGTTTSTTTDANGVYTLSNLATGTYDMTVTAAGYSTTNVPGVDAYGVSTRNVSMTPSASTSWTVTDTFTRDPNTDLGHTEDANAIPWVKTSGNTNALISSNALLLGVGSAPGGASLGRSFTPDNFDLSVKMTWDQSLIYSQWSGIAYRQNKTGVYNQGYFLYCPYADGDGNATIQLRYNGTSIASGVINTDYMWGGGNGVTLRISVYGNCHKVWVNDVKVIDTVDAQKASGGYVGLFCDEQNSVSWDDLNISYSAPTNVNSITDAKAL